MSRETLEGRFKTYKSSDLERVTRLAQRELMRMGSGEKPFSPDRIVRITLVQMETLFELAQREVRGENVTAVVVTYIRK